MKKSLLPIPRFGAVLFLFLLISSNSEAQSGRIAQKILELQQTQRFTSSLQVFNTGKATSSARYHAIQTQLRDFSLLDLHSSAEVWIKQPAYLSINIPVGNGKPSLELLLYKETISPNGFSLMTSHGKSENIPEVIHYRGSLKNDPHSVAAFSFSAESVAGMIHYEEGNLVIGKLEDGSGQHILYNDKDLIKKTPFTCNTDTNIPLDAGTYFKGQSSGDNLTSKCVNWYWETDFDIFSSKGSVANVNTFMQGIFNQVAVLYANDGISISLQTLFVWTESDPYTGPSTSDYLSQFGNNRTSFAGDLATLIGFQGNGGVAWINGLCSFQNRYKMAYAGINNGYSTVPTYSWTVEVITHEQGHSLGSRHTHDCVWNGNNTKIDGCGDAAGYPSGSCAVVPVPAGGGTIMSYCHLTGAGIKFNLGFGPQPTALIINNINNASCLNNCSGCNSPAQPAAINGATQVCSGAVQTYSVTPVSGATGYVWTLPSGWSGNSSTNTINITAGTSAGNISVTATNSCGNSAARSLAVSSITIPVRPGIITGNIAVCTGITQIYTVSEVAGASSYAWTLPSGWSGNSTTNSISVTPGTGGGAIGIKAVNQCGISAEKLKSVKITSTAPTQPVSITGATTVCQSSVQTYSVAAVNNASSYIWTFPSGWVNTSTAATVNVKVGTGSGTISVMAVNGCGNSSKRTRSVTTQLLPARPGIITVSGGTTGVCPGQSRTYEISALPSLTYTWTTPAGGTITSGQGTNRISVTYNSNFIANGTVKVVANNPCGSGIERTLTVPLNKPSSPGSITGSTSVCEDAVHSYSIAAVSGASSYSWTIPSGAVIQGAANGSSVSIRWGSQGGTLSVKAANGCGSSGSRSVRISIACAAPMVKNAEEQNAVLYPNPALNSTQLKFFAPDARRYQLVLTDVTGKVLLIETFQSNSGINIHPISLKGFSSGSYFVQLRSTQSKKTLKLQVQ